MTRIEQLRCRIARSAAVRSVWAGGPPSERIAAHTGQCLTCQARLAQVRLLARTLHSIRDEVHMAPTGLMGGVMARLDEPLPSTKRPTLRRRNLAPALVAATAAAAVVLLARRRAAA